MEINDVKAVFSSIPQIFDPKAAGDMEAIFQFDITGEGGGNWNLTIKNGTCEVREGSHEFPTVTLIMDSDVWLAMVKREMNGMQAFMNGKLNVRGDIILAQKIPDLFPF